MAKGILKLPEVYPPRPYGQVHSENLNPQPRREITTVGKSGTQGKVFRLSVGPTGAPIIQSGQTGQFWMISWDRLVNLAIAEGIETPIRRRR